MTDPEIWEHRSKVLRLASATMQSQRFTEADEVFYEALREALLNAGATDSDIDAGRCGRRHTRRRDALRPRRATGAVRPHRVSLGADGPHHSHRPGRLVPRGGVSPASPGALTDTQTVENP